jgi:hypothetical protein
MKDLIEALTILLKYANEDKNPTNCSHDEFFVGAGIGIEDMSNEDVLRLDELGFFWNEEYEGFSSYRFGSC